MIIIILMIMLILVALLSCSRSFCDFYALHVYPGFADWMSRLTNHVPFLIGEVCFILLFGFLFTWLLLEVIRIFCHKALYQRIVKRYRKSMAIVILLFLLCFGWNYLLLLRTTPLTFGTKESKVYSLEDLQNLRNQMAIKLNEICESIDRDENGYPIVPDNMELLVQNAVLDLQEEFPAFVGNCPTGKFARFSDVMEWMDIGGFTYPFTSEVSLNRYTDQFYYPFLYAHEMTHHFGYFRENEGNFFGYLALVRSENPFLQYSGYYDAYVYVASAYQENVEKLDPGMQQDLEQEKVYLNPQIVADVRYFYDLSVIQYEENVNQNMENMFSGVSEQIADVGWNVQDAMLDEATYDGVVELLLRYYDKEKEN